MKRTALSKLLIVSAIVVAGSRLALAQPAPDTATYQPMIVAHIASHDALMRGLQVIGKASPADADGSKFVQNLSKLLGTLASVEGLTIDQVPGVDATRPWGVALITDGLDIVPYAFLPVSDVSQALETLAPLIGEAIPGNDGTYTADVGRLFSLLPALPLTPTGTVEMHLREQDGWLYAVQLPEHFDVVLDPAQLDLEPAAGAVLALDVHVRTIPEALRTMAVDQAGTLELPGLNFAPERMEGESDAQFAFRQRVASMLQSFGTELLRDGERCTARFAIDEEKQQMVVDVDCRAAPETPLARHFNDLREEKSRFAALAPTGNDVMTAGLTMDLDETRIATLSQLLESYRSAVADLIDGDPRLRDTERGPFRELLDGWAAAIETAIRSGRLDLAMRITQATAASPGWTMVGGIALPDPAAMDQLYQRLAELIDENPGAGSAELSVDKQGETAIHRFQFPATSSASAEMKLLGQLFPGGLIFHVATTNDAAWIALGHDGLNQLKSAIAGETAPVQPMRFAMRASPLLPNLSQLLNSPQLAMALTLMSAQLAAGDQATLDVTCDENSLHLHGTAAKGYMTVTTTLVQLIPSLLGGQGGGGRIGFGF